MHLAREALSRLRTDVVLMLLERRGIEVDRDALHAALLQESSTRKVFEHFLRTGRRAGLATRIARAWRAMRAWLAKAAPRRPEAR